METGYMFMHRDGTSLDADFKYNLSGAWQETPGEGTYVGLDDALAGGCCTYRVGELLVEMECEEPTGAFKWSPGYGPFGEFPIAVGMPRYRRVRVRRVVAPGERVTWGDMRITAFRDGVFRLFDVRTGTSLWYRGGRLHRDDGPAVEYASPRGWGNWYRSGKHVGRYRDLLYYLTSFLSRLPGKRRTKGAQVGKNTPGDAT